MKILLVHNYYRAHTPSGENAVVDAEIEQLSEAGHNVSLFSRSNDEVESAPVRTLLSGSLLGAHNPFSVRALQRHLASFRPDVVHVHNTFPLLSPAVVPVARASGAAVVVTMHNYRLICAQGGFLRAGGICTRCLDSQSTWPAIKYGCYRGRAGSLPVAASIAYHRRVGTWRDVPHAVIALTEFQKRILATSGLPAERVHVKGNFASGAEPIPFAERDGDVVFVGRVSEEKGVHCLLDAWALLGLQAPRLRIVGGGEGLDSSRDYAAAAGLDDRVEFMGALPSHAAMKELARARLLVFPSLWYEPFGLSVVEAYARGVPVLASNLGSLPDLVQEYVTGSLFPPGDAQALAAKVAALCGDPGQLQQLSDGAYAAWCQQYAPDSNLARLEAIYAQAIAETAHHSAS